MTINFRDSVKPGLPFLPLKNNESVKPLKIDGLPISANNWRASPKIDPNQQMYPLAFSKTGDPEDIWYLPYETQLGIGGKNIFAKRYVFKGGDNPKIKGSIKEYWAQDDYTLNISGFLMGALERGNVEDCYPIEDFQKLVDYMTSGILNVYHPVLELLNINKIVVEAFDFPFTKGGNVQAYQITALSDFDYTLTERVRPEEIALQ